MYFLLIGTIVALLLMFTAYIEEKEIKPRKYIKLKELFCLLIAFSIVLALLTRIANHNSIPIPKAADVSEIEIELWFNASPPSQGKYLLKQQNGELASAGIIIPKKVLQQFLALLEEAQYNQETYQPKIIKGQPALAISLKLSFQNKEVIFFTHSNALEFNPWCIRYREEMHPVSSTHPGSAFALLEPYLLEIKQAQSSK